MTTSVAKIEELFKKYDKNGDGKISRKEFSALFKTMDGAAWDEQRAERLFNAADADKSNSLSAQEFLNWVFRKPQGRMVAKAAKDKEKEEELKEQELSASLLSNTAPIGEIASDESSSSESSVSSGDEAEKAQADSSPSRRGSRGGVRKKKVRREKPVISAEAFYEMITYKGLASGQVGARIGIGEFAAIVAKLVRSGFGANVPRLIPQAVPHLEGTTHECEEVSPFELAHLFLRINDRDELVNGTPEQRLVEGLKVAEEQRDVCRQMEFERECDLEKIGVDPEAYVGFGVFSDLVRLVADLMRVDSDHLLNAMLCANTDAFEMTNAMAKRVMEALFLKSEKRDGPVLRQCIKSNDFMRMCHVQQLADPDGKQGIPHAQLTLFFASTLQALPRLLGEREVRRGFIKKRNSLGGVQKQKQKHHHHKSISGRIKLGVLFDELFKAMPPGTYASTLQMVLQLIEIADAENAMAKST